MSHPNRPLRALALLSLLPTLASPLSGCTEGIDRSAQAAKERIFSPEEPRPEITRAAETLNPTSLPGSPKLFRRIVGMERLETARRIGRHRAITNVKMEWVREGRSVTLSENHELAVDEDGHFKALYRNDADAGIETLFVDGQAFTKTRYGPFRPRRLDRAQESAWRNRAAPGGPLLLSMLGGRIVVQPGEPLEQDGRPAKRFQMTLSAVEPTDKQDNLPPPVYGQWRDPRSGDVLPGPDPDTARRLQFEKNRQPQSLEGHVVVDDATSILLGIHAKATFTVPPMEDEDDEARLTLTIDYSVYPSSSLKVMPPSEDEVEPLKLPRTLKDPLAFLKGEIRKESAKEQEPEDDPPAEDERTPERP